MLKAFAELREDGARIEVWFNYSPDAVAAIKAVPGARFVPKDKSYNGRPHWTIPADLESAKRLREEFGAGLQLGNAVREWGREEVRRTRNLASLTTADDAELERVEAEAAEWLRPYQRADVKMMSLTNVLNANQPGVGKTVEVIYAAAEAGLEGPHLVLAPITLHLDPWAEELEAHAPGAQVFWGNNPNKRKAAMAGALAAVEQGNRNVWLILNPDMIRVKKVPTEQMATYAGPVLSRDHKGNGYVAKPDVAPLFDVKWDTLTVDEFHKAGLGEDRNTLFARALHSLGRNARRRYALSGTPMGGKPIRLWGVLNFIEPELYGSKWRWAEQWLTNKDGTGPVDAGSGTGIGGLQPGREDAFYAAHAKHMVRRTRKEALPGLPDKVVIDVDVEMTAKQAKLYREFERGAEADVDGGRISAAGLLAEFARLKQLANAACRIEGDVVQPTEESGKLPVLLERLDGFGFRKDNPEPGVKAIVASESKRMVELVEGYLREQGLVVRRLDGSVTGDRRTEVIDWYKEPSDEARILVMTTQTGGVGLNLGMTGSIHILDETWNPDDQEQLEDRGMRNRTEPLMVLYYRTKGTIQEYIAEVAAGKAVTNANVMDIRRAMLKARAAR